jgi:wyosine [tRNA(Phe)-imidazoG37] synthetase (radical SAM superfamily)
MFKSLFGPVPSRRLGMSLGVDIVPRKVCSLDCVYCEVGKTTLLTVERKEYVPFATIKDELVQYFSTNPDPEYITFSGSGEPTLYSRINDVIDFIKIYRPDIPIALLTNGTLLSRKEIRDELLRTDVVLPSLDAVEPEIFNAINRPEKSIVLEDYINGLIQFRKEFAGKIYLEVFILPGYNDAAGHIRKMRETVKRIEPDKIQLNTLDRPGTIQDLRPATRDELEKLIEILGLPNTEIIANIEKRENIISYRKDVQEAILETISRRPCTLDDLATILGLHINEINKYLTVLEDGGKIEAVQQERGLFYKCT